MRSSFYVALTGALAACSDRPEASPPDSLAPDAEVFRYVGRVDSSDAGAYVLAGAASYVEFGLGAGGTTVLLTAADYNVDSTWAVAEVDEQYLGRYAVHHDDTLRLDIAPLASGDDSAVRRVRVFHAAEQLMGRLRFHGTVGGAVQTFENVPTRRVAFFGDSMSGGAASDVSGGPCSSGLSNANAYLAFPARIGRALDADYLVHAASGRGLYTNWNGQDPPLPDLLPHLYMDTADARPYALGDFDADLAVVALGTNDLNSAPDLRAEFDPAVFEASYRRFVDTLHEAYPRAALALIGTPMHGGAKNDTLNAIIARVAAYAKTSYPHLDARAIPLEDRELHGCPAGPHPSLEDHAVIAEEIVARLTEAR